jgi:hypothetical protein
MGDRDELRVMIVTVQITGHSGFPSPPTVVMLKPDVPQGESKPTLRVVS